MFLIDGLKAIGGFFAKVFSGLIGVFMQDFEDMLEQTINMLLFSTVPGSQKFKTALNILENYAIKKGKVFVNRAARAAIELRLFEVNAETNGEDPKAKLEGLIDLGLEQARLAVMAVDESDLTGDDERRDAAVAKLWDDFEATGKTILLDKNLLHVLVELALDELIQDRQEQ